MHNGKLTINLLSEETIEEFNKQVLLASIRNNSKRVKQCDIFKEMIEAYKEKHGLLKPEEDNFEI